MVTESIQGPTVNSLRGTCTPSTQCPLLGQSHNVGGHVSLVLVLKLWVNAEKENQHLYPPLEWARGDGKMDPLCVMSESAQQLFPISFFYAGCSEISPAFLRPSCPSGPEPAYSPVHVKDMHDHGVHLLVPFRIKILDSGPRRLESSCFHSHYHQAQPEQHLPFLDHMGLWS